MTSQENSNVYVLGVPVDYTEDDIRRLFSSGGLANPDSVKRGPQRNPSDSITWALIRYSCQAEAEEAINKMKEFRITPESMPLIVKFATNKHDERDYQKRGKQEGAQSFGEGRRTFGKGDRPKTFGQGLMGPRPYNSPENMGGREEPRHNLAMGGSYRGMPSRGRDNFLSSRGRGRGVFHNVSSGGGSLRVVDVTEGGENLRVTVGEEMVPDEKVLPPGLIKPSGPCVTCNKDAQYQCQKCRVAWYCGMTCFGKDWDQQHRFVCGQLRPKRSQSYEPVEGQHRQNAASNMNRYSAGQQIPSTKFDMQQSENTYNVNNNVGHARDLHSPRSTSRNRLDTRKVNENSQYSREQFNFTGDKREFQNSPRKNDARRNDGWKNDNPDNQNYQGGDTRQKAFKKEFKTPDPKKKEMPEDQTFETAKNKAEFQKDPKEKSVLPEIDSNDEKNKAGYGDNIATIVKKEVRFENEMVKEETVSERAVQKADLQEKVTEIEQVIFEKPLLLLPSEEVKVSVELSHVESPSDFWLQLKQNKPTLVKLLKELENKCPLQKPLKNWQVGHICAAKFEGSWYRAQVISAEPLHVLYIDYGNTTEEVEVTSIPKSCQNLPPLAFRCTLSHVVPCNESGWSLDETSTFQNLCYAGLLEAVCEKLSGGTALVTLYNEKGDDLSDLLIKEGKGKAELDCSTEPAYEFCAVSKPSPKTNEPVTPVIAKPEKVAKPKPSQPKPVPSKRSGVYETMLQHAKHGEVIDICVAEVMSSTEFAATLVLPSHKEKALQCLQDLESACDDAYDKRESDWVPHKGDMVAAKSPSFGWNRGCIKNVMGKLYDVCYVDYATSEIVDTVIKLPESCSEVPSLGFKCSVIDKFTAEENQPLSIKVDKSGEGVKVTFQNEDDVIHGTLRSWDDEIELNPVSLPTLTLPTETQQKMVTSNSKAQAFAVQTSNGTRVKPRMAAALPLHSVGPITIKNNDKVIVCLFETNCVYLTLESMQQSYTEMIDDLNAYCLNDAGSFSKMPPTTTVVACLNPVEQLYCRGKVKAINGDDIEVVYLDLGITATVTLDQLKPLPARFLDFPVYCERARLYGVYSVLSPKLLGEFTKRYCNVVLTVKVKKERPLCVELFDGNVNINQQMCKKGTPYWKHLIEENRVNESPIPRGERKKYNMHSCESFKLDVGEEAELMVLCVDCPTLFIGVSCVEEDKLQFKQMQDDLQLYIKTFCKNGTFSPQPGELCLALSKKEKAWVRGVCITVQGPVCHLLWIDTGGREYVQCNNIRCMNPEFLWWPHGVQCMLDGFQSQVGEDNEDVAKFLGENLNGKRCIFNVKALIDDVYVVESQYIRKLLEKHNLMPAVEKNEPQTNGKEEEGKEAEEDSQECGGDPMVEQQLLAMLKLKPEQFQSLIKEAQKRILQ